MKKLTFFFLALLAFSLGFQACDDTKTYAEMLEEEDDAIDAFIRDSNITVITQSEFYQNDSMTNVANNEYVQLASGVYMQILDKGVEDLTDTVKNNDIVIVRFSEYNIKEKMATFSNLDLVAFPDQFRYTVTSTSIAGIFVTDENGIGGYYPSYIGSTAVPAGWLVPLEYVRNKAHVKLIVPSKMGINLGADVIPYYYDIRYQIWD